jgi:hypothetical protein
MPRVFYSCDREARRKMTRKVGQPDLLSASLEHETSCGIRDDRLKPRAVQVLESCKFCVVEVIF